MKRENLLEKLHGEDNDFMETMSLEVINLTAKPTGQKALIKITKNNQTRSSWYFTKETDDEIGIRDLERKALEDFFYPSSIESIEASKDEPTKEETKELSAEPEKKTKTKKKTTKKSTKKKAAVKNIVFDREQQLHKNLIIEMLDKNLGKTWREHAPVVKAHNVEISGKVDFLDESGNILPDFQKEYLDKFKELAQ